MSYELRMTPEAEKQISLIMNDKSRTGLQRQLKKALGNLRRDPRYPALHSHLLSGSEEAMGIKIWTSYVQNNTPQAHRILWTYGKKEQIVVLGVVPHY